MTPQALEAIIALDPYVIKLLLQRGRRNKHIGHLLKEIEGYDEAAGETAETAWSTDGNASPPHNQVCITAGSVSAVAFAAE